MAKRKGKVKENDNSSRFEQIQLFEILFTNDVGNNSGEIVEREQQSIVYTFEREESVGQLGITTSRGDQRALQSSLIGDSEGTTNLGEMGLDDENVSKTESNESSERDNNGVVDVIESDETEILRRVHLLDTRLSTDTKIQYNVDAIRTLKTIQKEMREATFDEKTTLSLFSGWGGCPAFFNENDSTYLNERIELKQLLTSNEYQDAKASTLNSFYTPLSIVDNIYKILDHMGFKQGRILETSMGTGNFIGRMSEDMYNDSEISGVELDGISSAIADLLYDKIAVQNTGFEKNTLPNNYFDLAISNVPFGNYQIHDKDFNDHHWNIHNYFFGKALSKVRDGGLIAFITSTDTMDGNSDIMEYIDNHADFIGAIRLPNNVFMLNGANTQTTSDIIFLKRNDEKHHKVGHEEVLESIDGKIAVTVGYEFGYVPKERLQLVQLLPAGYVLKDYDVIQVYKAQSYPGSRIIDGLLDEFGSMKLADYEIPSEQVNTYLLERPEYEKRSLYTKHRYVNDYFISHPEMVFGTIGERTNQYGTYELTVNGNLENLDTLFKSVITTFPQNIYEEGETIQENELELPIDSKHADIPLNSFFIENEKLFYRNQDTYYQIKTEDELKDVEIPDDYEYFKNQKNIDKAIFLIEMAKTTLDVLNLQKTDETETKYLARREDLNHLYDTFYSQYGALHKRGNISLLKDDSNVYLLESLEEYNSKTKEAKKADIFFERTIQIQNDIKFVDTLQDAIRVSLDTYGELNVPYMSSIYSKNEDEVTQELLDNGYAFIEPKTKKVILAEEYLSGDIYEKIEIASQYHYADNVDALENVLPERIEAEDIKPQLGSTWIPVEYVNEFIHHLFQERNYNRSEISYNSLVGQYFVSKPSKWSMSSIATDEWGVSKSEGLWNKTQREYTGYDLLFDVLNSNIPTIKNTWDELVDGEWKRKSELNTERTTVARDLADQLEEVWEEWLYSDYERKVNLVNIYNRKFNNTRLREYNGSFLSFPEMTSSIQLEPYQKNAIARIMDTNTNTLLWQQVGAGKTFEMVAAGMEMKRLGIRNKILYIVPNHLVSQWQKEFLTLYPDAKLLVATNKNMDKGKRHVFVNKIATGNYDAIIMSHNKFEMLSVSKQKQEEMLRYEIDVLQKAIERMQYESSNNSTQIVKRLEKRKKDIENKILKLADAKRDDNLIPFDELGIDYLFVDEAHVFKNLYFPTSLANVPGISTRGSGIASDLLLKCQILQENNGGICFATGTPVTNSMAELYTMQRFLQPDELEKMGIDCFDAWAKVFGKVVNNFEISVDGSRFVNKSRFCKFYNVTELMTCFRDVAEIQTASMLRSALQESTLGRTQIVPPTHIGGKPQVIAIEPSAVLEDYIANIVERTDAIHAGGVNPRVDNMLKITTDSKKASIDMRLVDPSMPDDENGKLWTIAKKVAEIYRQYDEVDATQLIFCDSSTPTDDGSFNVYDDIKNKICLLGIPNEEIAFIHDYNSEISKLNLYKEVNSGKVRVLFGSTQKLGAGTNVQERLIAIHHIDVPWRASDVEQQNGRAFRQGNMFEEIYEFRYVTKKSFDAYSWQMVETKSSYMQQLLEGSGDKREMEEDNRESFGYAEVKAIASDNPIIKEKFEVDSEIKRLEGLKKQYNRKRLKAQDEMVHIPKRLENLELYKKTLLKEVSYFDGQHEKIDLDDHFDFVDDKGHHYKTCKDAWEYAKTKYDGIPIKNFKPVMVGEFMKAKVHICLGTHGEGHIIRLETPARFIEVDACNSVGRVNFARMQKSIQELETKLKHTEIEIEKNKADYLTAKNIVGTKFQYEDVLRDTRARQKEINRILEDPLKESIGVVKDEVEEIEEQEDCFY